MLGQSDVQGPVWTQRTQSGAGRWSETALGGNQPGRVQDEHGRVFGGNREQELPALEYPGAFRWAVVELAPPHWAASPDGPGCFFLLHLPQGISLCSQTRHRPCLFSSCPTAVLAETAHLFLDDWEPPVCGSLCLYPVSSYSSLSFPLLSDLPKMQFRPCSLP